jgi:hypothetical protein
MAHPLDDQLRFARSEFRRGLEGVSDEETLLSYGTRDGKPTDYTL